MIDGPNYACTAVVSYKPGMRERGDQLVEDHFKRWTEGYRGFLIQTSLDDPNTAIYISF
jgi:hypothetical protein